MRLSPMFRADGDGDDDVLVVVSSVQVGVGGGCRLVGANRQPVARQSAGKSSDPGRSEGRSG